MLSTFETRIFAAENNYQYSKCKKRIAHVSTTKYILRFPSLRSRQINMTKGTSEETSHGGAGLRGGNRLANVIGKKLFRRFPHHCRPSEEAFLMSVS